MTVFQAAAVGIIGAVLALTVKKQSPEIAMMITVSVSVLIFLMALPLLASALGVARNIGGYFNGHGEHIALVLKILGIAYVSELGAQICADAGEGAIASKIELAGKVIMMAIAAPVLLDVLQTIVGIMP